MVPDFCMSRFVEIKYYCTTIVIPRIYGLSIQNSLESHSFAKVICVINLLAFKGKDVWHNSKGWNRRQIEPLGHTSQSSENLPCHKVYKISICSELNGYLAVAFYLLFD